ncbi:MAG: aminoacyl-tRNA deacylase [Actinobacteria bacterium]|nr:MAG: aminoacyl-tRNA deacylase [Actinomycetota bacterium]
MSHEAIKNHPAVERVRAALFEFGITPEITILSESARSAKEAAAGLGIEVGQVCSSLIFTLGDSTEPLLILTSGRHRVDTDLVANNLGVSHLGRADADIVRSATGFAIGGVSPVAHPAPLRTIIDLALNDYDVVWAAAGHPHAVYPTTFGELLRITGAVEMKVGD